MKVSREGIVLIKSFEGFRPRAIRRDEGGWVIGYGHTLSAREGASVSEADAELLLRYDLLPVEKSVNHAGSAVLNQHQFDALVSFAFSVGVDKFQTSDVLGHLASGAIGQAADALMGWPEPALPQAALRRRAAERALFVADPALPVAVSDLLVAPIEPVASLAPDDATEETTSVAQPTFDTPAEPVDTSPHEAAPAETAPAATAPAETAPADLRGAAVSSLLGEADDVLVPSFAPPPPEDTPVVEDDVVAAGLPSAANDTVADAGTPPEIADTVTPFADKAAEPADEPPVAPPVATSEPVSVAMPRPDAATEPTEPTAPTSAPDIGVDRVSMAVQRYSPYGAAMVGPLPFLQPASARNVESEIAASPPVQQEEQEEQEEQPATVEIAVVTETPNTETFAPAAEIEPLVLSGADDFPASAMTRQPWTIEERVEPVETTEGGLFGEDLSLTQGGAPVMRHGDIEFEAPASFDWSETGAFIIMGAVGLTAFGAAMAAFRLASEQSGGDETTIIAWVLAVIGAACVGVSSFNLYRRWGLPGGDN